MYPDLAVNERDGVAQQIGSLHMGVALGHVQPQPALSTDVTEHPQTSIRLTEVACQCAGVVDIG